MTAKKAGTIVFLCFVAIAVRAILLAANPGELDFAQALGTGLYEYINQIP